jgi:hypothetical protein
MKRSRGRLVTRLSFLCRYVCQARLTSIGIPGGRFVFDQLTVVKPKYTVGAKVLVYAVGSEHHSYPRSTQVLKHLAFVFVIQCRRRLVQ